MPAAVKVVLRWIKHKTEKHSSNTWAILEQLIRLASAANIPICGGAFSLASEVINIFNEVGNTQTACKDLMSTMSLYVETIWQFVEAMDPEYLKSSDDRQVVMARNTILTFKRHLEDAFSIVSRVSRQKGARRLLQHTAMKDDIDACTRRVTTAYEGFKSARSNIIVAIVAGDDKRPQQESAELDDPFKVAGARALRHQDLPDLERLVKGFSNHFWENVYEAQFGDRKRLVKIYDDTAHGKEAFLQDLKLLGRSITCNVMRVWGHCHKAQTPFIVLSTGHITPFKHYMLNVTATLPEEAALLDVWGRLVDMTNAAVFLDSKDPSMSLRDAIREAFVDDHTGQVMIAPVKARFFPGSSTSPVNGVSLQWVHDAFKSVSLPAAFRNVSATGMVRFDPRPSFDLKDASWPTRFCQSIGPTLKQLGYPLTWPDDVRDWSVRIGDVGTFVQTPKGAIFRKLGNVCSTFGGARVHLQTMDGRRDEWLEFESAHGVYRRSIEPSKEEDSSQSGAQVELRGYMSKTAKFETTLGSGSETSWTSLSRHGRHIAREYGVSPTELVLVTLTVNFADLDPKLPSGCRDTVYAHVHANEAEDIPYQYWTLDGRPLSRSEADVKCPDTAPLKFGPYHPGYIQMWREDFFTAEDFEDGPSEPLEPVAELTLGVRAEGGLAEALGIPIYVSEPQGQTA